MTLVTMAALKVLTLHQASARKSEVLHPYGAQRMLIPKEGRNRGPSYNHFGESCVHSQHGPAILDIGGRLP